jgi:hypothetical protein
MSALRMARTVERARLTAFGAILDGILGLEAVARAHPIVVGGLAIEPAVYPAPATRHSGSLTLLLATPEALPDAAAALAGAGFLLNEARTGKLRRVLAHGSGMPLVLYGDRLSNRLRSWNHAGISARGSHFAHGIAIAPGLADLWVATALALTKARPDKALTWAVDAVLIARRLGPSDLEVLPPALAGLLPLAELAALADGLERSAIG